MAAKEVVCIADEFLPFRFSSWAEAQPIPTYLDYGEQEYLVADERGYEELVHKMAQDFLVTSEGKILDSRLQLNKVNNMSLLSFLFLSLLFYL